MNPKTKHTTCITQVSKRIIEETKCTHPNAEPPWRPSEIDFEDRVQIYTLGNLAGESVKKVWANNHMELVMEEEDNRDILFIYSDSSLLEKNRRRHTGFGIVGYCQGRRVFEQKEALREHTEVYDAEMVGLHAAAKEAR